MALHVDKKSLAKADFRTQSGHYSLAGEGLCIGYDSGDAVSAGYRGEGSFAFGGGRIVKVVYDVADDAYIDVERRFAAKLARD